MNIPLVLPIASRIAPAWFFFNANDVELFTEFLPIGEPPALCIVSLNHAKELRAMLEVLGYYHLAKQAQTIVFRTSNATVMRWAIYYCALSSWKENHRPRFMATVKTSPQLFELCDRAYKLSIEKKRKRILLRS